MTTVTTETYPTDYAADLETSRGYQLPHPEGNQKTDIRRVAEAIMALDVDVVALLAAIADLDTPEEVDSKVDAAVAALVDSSPGALDTLNELAAALGDDPNHAATVTAALADRDTKAEAAARVAAALAAFVATTAHLGDDIVTTAKIAADAITGALIAAGQTLRSPTLDDAKATGFFDAEIHTITYAATITPDLTNGPIQHCILTGDVDVANPTSVTPGRCFLLVLEQDGTGGHVWTAGTNFRPIGGGDLPDLSTDPGAVDSFNCLVLRSDFIILVPATGAA